MWALPFLTVLCPSERYYIERGRTHRSLTERARQALHRVRRWSRRRENVVVADSRFAALALLAALPDKLDVVTRLRLDAALYEPASERRAGYLGRPRKKGKRLPTPTRTAGILMHELESRAQGDLDLVRAALAGESHFRGGSRPSRRGDPAAVV